MESWIENEIDTGHLQYRLADLSVSISLPLARSCSLSLALSPSLPLSLAPSRSLSLCLSLCRPASASLPAFSIYVLNAGTNVYIQDTRSLNSKPWTLTPNP